MDFNSETDGHAADFYLSYPEEEVRSELAYSMAKITQTIHGTVSIGVQEDLLEDFLNVLHAPMTAGGRREKTCGREMRSLKAQLKEAQVKCDLLSEKNGDLKEKLDQMKEEN
ncbi:hypothetical protein GBF38_011619 [Nibea albiflora]|uniref:Uncharacterized protein n=1 Tax=Nibea albiflora TaxID=240163 RepID=A0ACB7F514_NIBAL|nr:hypothetical protein GBF38_011619 [Nibea albiflora]